MTSRYVAALLLVAVGAAGVLVYQRVMPAGPAGQMGPGGGGRPGAGFGGFRGGGRSRFAPQPMLVEAAPVERAEIEERLELVGNLVGAATVEVAPKVDGRLREIRVRLGDPVTEGQVVGRVEDDELQQQLSQREASYEVARATVRQREADLALARTTRDRSRACSPASSWPARSSTTPRRGTRPPRPSSTSPARSSTRRGHGSRSSGSTSRTRCCSRRSTASSAAATSTPERTSPRTRRSSPSSTSVSSACWPTSSSATCGWSARG